MEESNTLSGLANKVIGALPVVGLVARIFSDEGGVGGDTIDFAEFRRRVGKKCSINDSRAFYEFKDRRGQVFLLFQISLLISYPAINSISILSYGWIWIGLNWTL